MKAARGLSFVSAYGLAFILAGCATVQTLRTDLGLGGNPELHAVPLAERQPAAGPPSLRPGDVYVFRFGAGVQQNETVTEVRGDRVTWRLPTGATWTTVSATMFNTAEWHGTAAYGSGQQVFTDSHGSLFPLRVGNVVRYTAKGESSREPGGWRVHWTCTVPSEERITVAAGTFDTYRVMCYRAGQLRTYYYAPSIDLYVLRITMGKDPGRKELVSFRRAAG
jgi:hypothetical protein